MLNNNQVEIWKPIKGYEQHYLISSNGRIKNRKNRILKTYTINSNYKCITFSINNERKHKLVHRLVAEAFIPNPNPSKYVEVNHKDENKHNNKAENLEWVTSKENKQHSIKLGTYDFLKTIKNTLGKKHKSNVSKYHNVGFDKRRNKWTAAVRHNGQNYYQKRFDTEKEAALHVNWILTKLKLTDRPYNLVI